MSKNASITRRHFLAATAGVAAASLGGCSQRPPAPTGAPNVLFIAIDDLNDWVGCLGGHPDAITPNIDRLADRGVLFTHAHTPSPLCNPSRVATMTGLFPSSTGVYLNRDERTDLIPDAELMMGTFMDQGFRVMGAGKILHAGVPKLRTGGQRLPEATPWWLARPLLERRYGPWDEYSFRRRDPGPAQKPANGPDPHEMDWAALDIDDSEMGDWHASEWVSQRLGRSYDRPFFLAFGLFRPHAPWYAPSRFLDLFDPDKVALPETFTGDLDDVPERARALMERAWDRADVNGIMAETKLARQAVAAYLACIAFADWCLGRVLDALDNGPNAHDTAVVLWSDHGFHLGEKSHWGKDVLWERATRVPMIISPAGSSPGSGRVCGRTVSLVDLYPTLCDVAGIPSPQVLEGLSLKPLVEDPNRAWERPALSTFMAGNHSVRSERWRYTRYDDGTEELYDHDADPTESINLAGLDRYTQTKADLASWMPAQSG